MADEWLELILPNDRPVPEVHQVQCNHDHSSEPIHPITASVYAPVAPVTIVNCGMTPWEEVISNRSANLWFEYAGTCQGCGKEWKFRTPKRQIRIYQGRKSG